MANQPEHIVRLTSVRNEMEAGIIVATLEEHGIPATMTGTFTAGFRAEAPGRVQINVAEADLDRAQQVLDDIANQREEVDWSQVDVGEPEEPPSATGTSVLELSRRAGHLVILAACLVGLTLGVSGGNSRSLRDAMRKLLS